MNARKLTKNDWQYIIDSIEEGYTQGEIRSIQNNKMLSGWWFLTNEGIVITF